MPDIDLSQQNDNGDTALIQAVWKGHKDITRMLLSDKRQMKSINVKSKSGKSAWSVADSDLQGAVKTLWGRKSVKCSMCLLNTHFLF